MEIDYPNIAELSVDSEQIAWAGVFDSCEIGLISVERLPVSNVWTVPAASASFVKTIYIAKLTGEDNGLDDLWLPISSCSARRKNAKPSYLSVVCPGAIALESEINAREDGDIIIYKGVQDLDGSRNLEAIASANFDYLRIDQGGKNQSGTLVGYRQKTYGEPATVEITGVSYRSVTTEGLTRLRGEVNLFINPGDTCTYGDISFVIDSISLTITSSSATMEVAE